MGSVKRGESRCRMEVEAHEVEGVRTNAICMILHVLARPGCAHRVSAFCLRFPLAFLQPAPAQGGGAKGLRAGRLQASRRDGKLFFLVFLGERPGRNSGILIGRQEGRGRCCHFKRTITSPILGSSEELSGKTCNRKM